MLIYRSNVVIQGLVIQPQHNNLYCNDNVALERYPIRLKEYQFDISIRG